MAAKLARRSFLAGLAAAPALSRAAPVRAQTTRPLAGLFTGGALSNNPAPIAQRVQQYDQWLTNGTRQTPLFIDFAAHDTWANALGSLALGALAEHAPLTAIFGIAGVAAATCAVVIIAILTDPVGVHEPSIGQEVR